MASHADGPVQLEIARDATDTDVIIYKRKPSLSARLQKSISSEKSPERRSHKASTTRDGEAAATTYKTYCLFIYHESTDSCDSSGKIKFFARVAQNTKGQEYSSLSGYGFPREDLEVEYDFCPINCPRCDPCCCCSAGGCCVSISHLVCCPCWCCINCTPDGEDSRCTENVHYQNSVDYTKACYPWFFYTAYLET